MTKQDGPVSQVDLDRRVLVVSAAAPESELLNAIATFACGVDKGTVVIYADDLGADLHDDQSARIRAIFELEASRMSLIGDIPERNAATDGLRALQPDRLRPDRDWKKREARRPKPRRKR